MMYVAVDYHKRYSQVEAMDAKGQVISHSRLSNEEQFFTGGFLC